MLDASEVGLEHPAAQEEPRIPPRVARMIPRVFLADEQAEVLHTTEQIIGDEFEIVGTAADGPGVLELAPALSPDVVVLDISMPVLTGIEVVLRLREKGSRARVIFLTVHKDHDFVEAAMSAGALGYVLKQCMATDLVPAIWKAMEGRTFISPSIDLP